MDDYYPYQERKINPDAPIVMRKGKYYPLLTEILDDFTVGDIKEIIARRGYIPVYKQVLTLNSMRVVEDNEKWQTFPPKSTLELTVPSVGVFSTVGSSSTNKTLFTTRVPINCAYDKSGTTMSMSCASGDSLPTGELSPADKAIMQIQFSPELTNANKLNLYLQALRKIGEVISGTGNPILNKVSSDITDTANLIERSPAFERPVFIERFNIIGSFLEATQSSGSQLNIIGKDIIKIASQIATLL